MATNRHLINGFDIVLPPITLNRGLLGMNSFIIEDGFVGVVTIGGVFKEIVPAGTYYTCRYRRRREIKVTKIDTRPQTLSISTDREFAIQYPVPVKVNLNMSLEYQVVNPRFVATEIRSPLTSLFDRVMETAAEAVPNYPSDQIRIQSSQLSLDILQRLKSKSTHETLGIEVLNVIITTLQLMDTGGDLLGQTDFEMFKQYQQDQYQDIRFQQTQTSWEWLLVHRPEIAKQLIAEHGEMARRLLDSGNLDIGPTLNRPVGTKGSLTNPFSESSILNPGSKQHDPSPLGQQLPTLPDPESKDSIHDRMREEIKYLEDVPGVTVKTKAGVDSHGIPDGSYLVLINAPRVSGGVIKVFIECPKDYPSSPPALSVEVDGQDQPYESALVRVWIGQYIVEILREIRQWFN